MGQEHPDTCEYATVLSLDILWDPTKESGRMSSIFLTGNLIFLSEHNVADATTHMSTITAMFPCKDNSLRVAE